jgi:xylulokinase
MPAGKPQPGRHEQDPEDWWRAASTCLRALAGQAEQAGYARDSLSHLAVTSTSGTVVLVDGGGAPVRPAIMYNDARAAAEAEEANAAGAELTRRLGYRFSPSFALPKLLWLARHEADRLDAAQRVCHPADFLVGRLVGRYDTSDTSNALKTGYDLLEDCWPAFIAEDLGLSLDKLPRVIRPGQPIGQVRPAVAEDLGLAPSALVMAGATDGTAAFFASGACQVGQWCSTLGTTLVLRGVSRELLHDPAGRIYCHAHPEGHWLPGAASSVGGECLEVHFPGRDLAELDAIVEENLPNELVIYPLARRGERFPFQDPNAEGFVHGTPPSEGALYAACLEAVGLVERWGLDIMAELGAPLAEPLFASGGAAKSQVWLHLRADILQRPLRVAADAHSAKGAALLAAVPYFGTLSAAVEHMVRFEKTVEPQPRLRNYLDGKYARFRQACAQAYAAAK